MKVSVFIATSLDGFIARKNGDLDWLPVLHQGGIPAVHFDDYDRSRRPDAYLPRRPRCVEHRGTRKIRKAVINPRALMAGETPRGYDFRAPSFEESPGRVAAVCEEQVPVGILIRCGHYHGGIPEGAEARGSEKSFRVR